MNKLLESAPGIIREAAKSPLGLFALMILVLAVLAFFFFRTASERTRVAIFLLLLIGVASFTVAIFRTPPPDTFSVDYPPPDRKVANNDCPELRGIPKSRIAVVEEGSNDVGVIGPGQSKEGPMAIQLTENRQLMGAIKFSFFPTNNMFKVETVIDAGCQIIEEYKNASRGGDRHVLQNWDSLEVRFGNSTYALRLGYDSGEIEANYFTRTSPPTINR